MAALGSATVNVEVVVDPWSLLTMRVWAANLEAAAELERAIVKWGDWLYGNWLGHLLTWPPNPLLGAKPGAPWVLPEFAVAADRVDAVPAADVRSRGRGWWSGLLNWSALRIFPRPPQLPRH